MFYRSSTRVFGFPNTGNRTLPFVCVSTQWFRLDGGVHNYGVLWKEWMRYVENETRLCLQFIESFNTFTADERVTFCFCFRSKRCVQNVRVGGRRIQNQNPKTTWNCVFSASRAPKTDKSPVHFSKVQFVWPVNDEPVGAATRIYILFIFKSFHNRRLNTALLAKSRQSSCMHLHCNYCVLMSKRGMIYVTNTSSSFANYTSDAHKKCYSHKGSPSTPPSLLCSLRGLRKIHVSIMQCCGCKYESAVYCMYWRKRGV